MDTSGVLAAIDPRQEHHAAAARALLQPQRRILSPFVLAELDYLIETNAGQLAELALLDDVARGAYELDPFGSEEMAAASAIIRRCADLRIGLADASIVVLAHRHCCSDVLTLDQWHFRVLVGPEERPFRLLPQDRPTGG